jgi:hypothetical protein
MKLFGLFLLGLLAASCKETPSQSIASQPFPTPPQFTQIVAYVYSGNQGEAGKKVVLVQTGETRITDANGLAIFLVVPGQYVVRAYDINRGGPSYISIDFKVDVQLGAAARVNIFDCPECL